MTLSILKTVAVAGALTIGAMSLAPQEAHARNAAPVIAGLAIGAIIVGALASRDRAHARDHYYYKRGKSYRPKHGYHQRKWKGNRRHHAGPAHYRR